MIQTLIAAMPLAKKSNLKVKSLKQSCASNVAGGNFQVHFGTSAARADVQRDRAANGVSPA